MATLRKIVIIGVLMSQSLAQAFPLAHYRQSYDAGGNYKKVSEQFTANIVSQLGVTASERLQMTNELKPILDVVPKRSKGQSSVFFKDIMETAVPKYRRLTEYQKPMTLDPSKFSYEVEAEIIERKLNFCTQSIEDRKSGRNAQGHTIGSFNHLINLLYQENIAVKAPGPQSSSLAAGTTREVIAKINKLLASQAVLGNRANILGPVTAIETTDGGLNRIVFGTGDQRLPLSLSMLLTFVLDDDDAFIEIQQCFLAVMGSMKETFTKELNHRGQSFFRRQIRNIIAEDEKIEQDRHKSLLAKYLDGVSTAGISEVKYMQDMVKMVTKNIDVLITKISGARQANSNLKRLTSSEVNGLIGLFILGRGGDLLSPQEVGQFQNASGQMLDRTQLAAQKSEITSDIRFYSTESKQLSRLIDHINSEEERESFEASELKKIEESL